MLLTYFRNIFFKVHLQQRYSGTYETAASAFESQPPKDMRQKIQQKSIKSEMKAAEEMREAGKNEIKIHSRLATSMCIHVSLAFVLFGTSCQIKAAAGGKEELDR